MKKIHQKKKERNSKIKKVLPKFFSFKNHVIGRGQVDNNNLRKHINALWEIFSMIIVVYIYIYIYIY